MKMRRITAMLLALLLALSLWGCSKKNSGSSETPAGPGQTDSQTDLEKKLKGVEKVKLDHVYSAEYLPVELDDGNTYIQSMQEANGQVYFTASFDRQVPNAENPEIMDYYWGMEILQLDGNELKVVATFTQESNYDEENSQSTDSYVNSISVAPDGTLWYVKEEYWNDWSDPENYIWEQRSALVHTDIEGNELLNMSMDSLKDPNSPDDGIYIQNMFFAENGNMLAMTNNGFIGLAPDGRLLFRSSLGQNGNTWISSVCRTGSGRIIALVYSYNEVDYSNTLKLMEVDPLNGNMTELDARQSAANFYDIMGGPGDTLLIRTNGGIDVYDLQTKQRSEMLNWLNCDMNSNYVQQVCALNDGRLLITERNWRKDNSMKLAYLKPVGESVEKYLIHFAALYLDEDIIGSIIDYNKRSDQFRIVFDDYSKYATDEDYQAGLKVLNQEIISGKIPDIFSVEGLPYDVYASKGLLLDLKPRLENDPDLHMEDYLENVFKAVERDGKICSLIPAFTLQTLVAKESYVGKESGWNMDRLQELIRQHPDAQVFADVTREGALEILLARNMDAFTDPETGKCSFNGPDFVRLLELVKSFPEEIDWEARYRDDPDYWQRQEGQYREGRTLLMTNYISNYTSIRDTYYQFDSDCTFIGFPGAKGSGAVIQPQMEIAISGRTKLDDQCWDFIRFLLSEEYQNELGSWVFPVRLDALKAQETLAMEGGTVGGPIVYRTVEGGGMVAYETGVTAAVAENAPAEEAEEAEGSQETGDGDAETGEGETEGEDTVGEDPEGSGEIDLPIDEPIDPGYNDWWSKPITQDMADKITNAILGAVQVYRQQTEIMAIVQEEAGAFFAGQKSAQAVADVIQSRVSLYVAESR